MSMDRLFECGALNQASSLHAESSLQAVASLKPTLPFARQSKLRMPRAPGVMSNPTISCKSEIGLERSASFAQGSNETWLAPPRKLRQPRVQAGGAWPVPGKAAQAKLKGWQLTLVDITGVRSPSSIRLPPDSPHLPLGRPTAAVPWEPLGNRTTVQRAIDARCNHSGVSPKAAIP